MFSRRRIYLDQAAGVSGNAGSPHEEGRAAKLVLEQSRERIARLLEVKADDVLFTSGATESNALAILGYVRAVRKTTRNNAHALYLPSAHASVVENMRLLADEGVVVEPLPITDGRVDTDALALMLTPNTVLVSMDAVCSETGVVWNTREVAATLERYRRDEAKKSEAQGGSMVAGTTGRSLVLHVDASQAPLTEKVNRSHFGADLLTFDVSKVSALRGLGLLVARRTVPLVPLYAGGGQERGLRPGSEPALFAREFADALTEAVKGRDAFVAAATNAREALLARLSEVVPEAQVNEGRAQAPNILNISLPGRDTDYVAALLDDMGFAVSTKSACETDSEEGSRAVRALTGDTARALATLRVSWGPETRVRDLVRFADALAESLKV